MTKPGGFRCFYVVRMITTIPQKKPPSQKLRRVKVEMPGVEPGSKRGSNMLSTCLAKTCFSCNGRIEATDHYLSSLIFAKAPKQNSHYSRFTCTAGSGRFRKLAPGRCLVPAPCAGIKCNLLGRITQQERSYFRQLKV